ncbi:ubiquinol-cytochrome c reductase cytochrome c1 subunit [Sphingomonas sp. BE123]|jgi:ubiquinol-cytochrome c reductase cytochrome c1 subunit|uniref:cytochrome c1 n=1 Tax=unclassified Sphingomonas TaxID=196159 RepID=UPI0028577CD6|nr:cytochrome c1 [Sphingomonas sp. BE123]MDR6853197.1 ubiquinol-cytochrome c reductase cytochrome c1 subunit [Sphingomonas sp. BE123]
MVRIGGFLVGLGFVFALILGIFDTVSNGLTTPKTVEEEFHEHAKGPAGGFSFEGAFGTYDKRQLQRGMQVYKEVCAACHSLRLVSFRDLAALGYSEGQIKTIAKGFQVPSLNPETGEPATRDGIPSDRFPSPYANDIAAAAANNNAIPPDLSLMAKARADGSNYIYSLLTGYQAQPAELLKKYPEAKTPEGLHYNPYFHTLNLAMAQPLKDGQVTYSDGTAPTLQNYAADVAAFLTWTAEPKMEVRKSTGFGTLIFLLLFCFFAYGAKKQIWRNVKD